MAKGAGVRDSAIPDFRKTPLLSTMNDPKLLTEFPPPAAGEWQAAAEKLLKGAPFDKVMRTRTVEGLTLEPIYTRDKSAAGDTLPGFDGSPRGSSASPSMWAIAQELPLGEPAEFNRALLHDLSRGQDCLMVLLDIATARGCDPDEAAVGEVGACGLSLATLADARRAFRGVLTDAVSFQFLAGTAGLGVFAILLAWLRENNIDPATVRGRLNMDPLGVLARSGSLPAPLSRLQDEMAAAAAFATASMPGFRSVAADGLPFHGAGASAVQELGATLASGLASLRALCDRGMDVSTAASQIAFTFSIGSDFFMELAKLRAARPLWHRIVTELGGSPESARMCVHARTGLYNKTALDPYVNLLRTTTEALAGAVAGVDSLCVGAFDEVIRTPDDVSRRLARNTQIILQEECELGVIDPAGGSWFIEQLTEDLARAAWEFFGKIEAEGGLHAALDTGWLHEELAATHQEREKRLAQRRLSMVGANQYPNIAESPLPQTDAPDYAAIRERRAREVASFRTGADHGADTEVMDLLGGLATAQGSALVEGAARAAAAGASLGEITRSARAACEGEPEISPALPSLRLAGIYETMRNASAKWAAANGHAPQIHLANLGPLKRHKARADFSRSFFATGGFECLYPDGAPGPDEAAAALLASGARVAVICGHDEDYPAAVPAICRAVKAADPSIHLILAGFPGDHEAAYREAGLDDYIFVKSDNYATNRALLETLGVLA